MTLELALAADGKGALVETDGTRVVILSSAAAPPGSTLQGRIAGETQTFQIKVRDCRQQEPDSIMCFRIEGRFVNLSKHQRKRLLAETKE